MATALNKNDSDYYSGTSGARKYYKDQAGWKDDQRPILPYTLKFGNMINRSRDSLGGATVPYFNTDMGNLPLVNNFNTAGGVPSWAVGNANKAYSRFVRNISAGNAGLAETAAEFRESLGAITNGALRMREAWRAIRRADLRRAIRSLTREDLYKIGRTDRRGLRGSRVGDQFSRRNLTQEAASTWLTWKLGILPTCSSIYEALEILNGDPQIAGQGRGTATMRATVTSGYSNTTNFTQRNIDKVKHSTLIQADYKVTNLNLALAGQLGVVNPVRLAYDLVPFSFVFDWAVNVGQLIDSWTDLVGIELSRKMTTHFLRGDGDWKITYKSGSGFRAGAWSQTNYNLAAMKRSTSLYSPMLDFQVPLGLDKPLSRAITSIALLITALKK